MSVYPAVVVLGDHGSTTNVSWFAFTNGRFSYDWVSCSATRCVGHRYQLAVGREFEA